MALKDGKVVEQGTHSELMAGKGLYFSLVTAQMVDAEFDDISETYDAITGITFTFYHRYL